MKYEISVSKRFKKRLKKLPKNIKKRVLKKVKSLKSRPNLGKTLKADLKGIRSLRIGDYRVLYEIIRDDSNILLLTVQHRKKVYQVEFVKLMSEK